MVDISIVNGVYKPTNITGGHNLVCHCDVFSRVSWDVYKKGIYIFYKNCLQYVTWMCWEILGYLESAEDI